MTNFLPQVNSPTFVPKTGPEPTKKRAPNAFILLLVSNLHPKGNQLKLNQALQSSSGFSGLRHLHLLPPLFDNSVFLLLGLNRQLLVL